MAEGKRRGEDDAADDEHVDDVFDDAIDGDARSDDESVSGGGGTATKARAKAGEKDAATKVGFFGRIGRIGRFVREVVAELRKVIWPSRTDLLTYTAVVVVFVTIMLAVVGGLDFAYAKGVLFVFGNPK